MLPKCPLHAVVRRLQDDGRAKNVIAKTGAKIIDDEDGDRRANDKAMTIVLYLDSLDLIMPAPAPAPAAERTNSYWNFP